MKVSSLLLYTMYKAFDNSIYPVKRITKLLQPKAQRLKKREYVHHVCETTKMMM